MKQLTQDLKKGRMEILEVPFPVLGDGEILVRNHFSVISSGTEGKTVTDARKGYIAKARSRQKEVKQVIDMIKKNGLKDTYDLVMNKLEAPSSLGYSCAGEVLAVGRKAKGFKKGDHIACGGAKAVHADIVSVPVNLCVKIPKKIPMEQAAFATIAAIAIQGVRQADLKLGENCAVIGLGLIGLLTLQLLESSGINVIGIDINEDQVKNANRIGIGYNLNRNKLGIENIIEKHTKGTGVDSVIITAGSSSLDPVNFAGNICRKRGKVVIVGGVPTGFDRSDFYKKELELKMSSSYGPGRYDPQYEEKGIDYPIGYVRWTENRNMQSYIDMLGKGKLRIGKLITHEFPLLDAPAAYNMILKRSEQFAGILIKYDPDKKTERKVIMNGKKYSESEVTVGFIGAGSFAQNILLPGMKGLCNFIGITTARGNNSKYVADKYKFDYCTDDAEEIITDKNINTVFIATRHDLHAGYVIKALKAGKNVFVEKPLALTEKELEEIRKTYLSPRTSDPSSGSVRLMVGYNRRFSPHIKKVKELFSDDQPKAMNIRINAGSLPKDHWINDPDTGGGRIIGEGCHFIDLAMFIAGSGIISVHANSMNDPNNLNDTVSINLSFENGSVANISYFSNGSKELPKECLEIFCDGTTVVIDDFKKMTIYREKVKTIKLKKQDKGHKEELKRFFKSIEKGLPSPIPFDDLYNVSKATLAILDSISNGN